MATHSNILAWKITWTEEPGGLQSMGLQRVGHDWATSLSILCLIHNLTEFSWGIIWAWHSHGIVSWLCSVSLPWKLVSFNHLSTLINCVFLTNSTFQLNFKISFHWDIWSSLFSTFEVCSVSIVISPLLFLTLCIGVLGFFSFFLDEIS